MIIFGSVTIVVGIFLLTTVDYCEGNPGGDNSDFEKYPGSPGPWIWLASLTKTGSKMPNCGGVLVHPQWVLTAAHCINGTNPEQWNLKFGDYDIKITDKEEITVGISKFIVHNNYYAEKYYGNDIALIKLKYPVTLKYNIELALLGKERVDYTKQVCYVAGWGEINEAQETTVLLLEAEVSISDLETCKRNYASQNIYVTNDMVCAGNEYKGSCKRDSGTPLVCRYNYDWDVVGITSFSLTLCSSTAFPMVYVRVASYLQWIDYIIKHN